MLRLFWPRILAPSASEMASITVILVREGGFYDIGIYAHSQETVISREQTSDRS